MIKKRKDVNPKRGKSEYGNVRFADETNKKYPIDTEEHIRAAWNYINKENNAGKYSSEDLKTIKSKIVSAWKSKIDKAGPPSAEHSVPVGEHVIFRSGKHTTKSGEIVEYTDNDLDEMCSTFSEDEPPSYIIGHSSDYQGRTLIPAFGRLIGGLKRIGHDLVAKGAEFSDTLAEWINQGFYSERSVEIGQDENGKKKIFAVAMLGAQPPSVKGMPSIMSALNNPAFAFSSEPQALKEFADSVNEPMSGAMNFDDIESSAEEDTLKNITEICGRFLEDFEESLSEGYNEEEIRQNIYSLTNNLLEECMLHGSFIEKLEQMEKAGESEYAEHRSFWKEFAESVKTKLFNSQSKKESEMDAQKEQSYKDEIAALNKKVQEFSEKELQREADKADNDLRASIHEFCESNKLNSPKAKEMKIEETIFVAAKAQGMKEFSEKDEKKEVFESLKNIFLALRLSPKQGEMKEFSNELPEAKTNEPERITKAREYFEKNKSTKEFAGMSQEQGTARALYLEMTGQVKF